MKMSTYSRIPSRRNLTTAASQRITRQNLLTLRAAELKEDKVRKMFAGILSELSTAFMGLFAVRQGKSTNMCKYYGHVIHGTKWEGYLPKCGDCGAEINSPSQLRKANTQPQHS